MEKPVTIPVDLTTENKAKILAALKRIELLSLENKIYKLGTMGVLELSYSNFFQNRFYFLMEEIKEARSILENCVFCYLDELAKFITVRKLPDSEIMDFAKRIVEIFKHELSLSAVAHWVFMVQNSTYPFDDEIMGFNLRKLTQMLRRYIQRQNDWVHKKFKAAEKKIEPEVYSQLIGQAIKSSEELNRDFSNLENKIKVVSLKETQNKKKAKDQASIILSDNENLKSIKNVG